LLVAHATNVEQPVKEANITWQKQDAKNILIYTLQKNGLSATPTFHVTQDSKAKIFHASLEIAAPIVSKTEGSVLRMKLSNFRKR
jgi:hypothetical protein